MSYGMKIINGSGTFIVDSTENFGHFHKMIDPIWCNYYTLYSHAHSMIGRSQ